MSEILIGRQPIFDRKLNVIAYELLYRSAAQQTRASFEDGDAATTQVILNAYSEIGLKKLVGERIAFINATRSFLTGKLPIPFPPSHVVLEILEDIPIDGTILKYADSLAKAGFKFALDDVVGKNYIADLMSIATIAKIDLERVNRVDLPDLVQAFKNYGMRLLAEKVESQTDYMLCQRLGFDFFQGYFLCKPTIIKGRRLETSRLVVMQSLAKMQDPRCNFESLEAVIAQDVNLGYKLLKLVNSGYYSLSVNVNSIRQAISLIGINQLRGWITLLLMSAVENKPGELTVIALLRARMCEMIARSRGLSNPETYFLVGLLSVLDALMDMSMRDITQSLPLAPEVVEALLHWQGSQGELLALVIAYERGEWDKVLAARIDAAALQRIYVESIHWAETLTGTIISGQNQPIPA